ncbi:MAG: hypothetical protein Q7U77_01810 [Sediminibacterium sp.]|uniref:hypothetical protein n=1 Tax=Sediminibacterium sp. TaxID=1917865 RepID=UPI0027284D25|nr:hypothetical protein [Sediminibacterium sp.]MDO8995339.1 hypothetical protein [Sediminibacterium sp.]
MSPTIFRGLIGCSVLLIIAAGVVDWLIPSLISQTLTSALENEPVPSLLENYPFISLAVLLPWLIAVLASTVGLLFFKRWARSMALYSTLIGLTLYSFFGPTLSSALASALTDASSLAWGAVLALAYYSPLSDRFAIKKSANTAFERDAPKAARPSI